MSINIGNRVPTEYSQYEGDFRKRLSTTTRILQYKASISSRQLLPLLLCSPEAIIWSECYLPYTLHLIQTGEFWYTTLYLQHTRKCCCAVLCNLAQNLCPKDLSFLNAYQRAHVWYSECHLRGTYITRTSLRGTCKCTYVVRTFAPCLE